MLGDTLRTMAHAIGAGPQVDVLLDAKFDALRHHYASPVLDFGAGTCFFANHLQQNGYSVTAADVTDRNRFPAVQLQTFEPPKLPFADRSFDTSVAHFVLHHIREQHAAFSELTRVTERAMIIAEDVVDSATDRVFTALHTASSPWSKAWSGFRSTRGWHDFFAEFPVNVVSTTVLPRWRTPHYPIRRVIFVLNVRPVMSS